MTEAPSFAELKGLAVLMMNHLQEKCTEGVKSGINYQYPVDPIKVMGFAGMLINGTAAVIWRQVVPAELLTEEPADEWTNEDWAFLTANVIEERKEEGDSRQRLIYPGVIEKYHVTRVLPDWRKAVREAVSSAMSRVMLDPVLKSLRAKSGE